PHIVVKIKTAQPIAVDDFAAVYTALGSQYRKFVQAEYPEVGEEATIYVRQVREGSIIVDLVPWVLATWASVPENMKRFDIVVEFVKKYGELLGIYLKGAGWPRDVNRSDLNDFAKQVAAIANDPNGSAVIEAAGFEDGKRKVRAVFRFKSKEAQ